MKKIKDKLKKITTNQKIGIVLGVIFLFIVVLNLITPYIADDYTFIIKNETGFLNKLTAVYKFQLNYYLTWTGRTIAHLIGQLFLLFPKKVFSIANSLIFICLVWLIYEHARNEEKHNIIILILIPLLLWKVIPVFGQSFIWLIGSVNYLWTIVILLAFLLFYRKKIIKHDNIIKDIGMLLFGIIAGWTNENTSFASIIIILGFMIIQKLQKEKIAKWQISGLIGNIIGFGILIGAPGNYARLDYFPEETIFIVKVINRVIDNSINLVNYLMPILIFSMILISVLIYNKKKIPKESILYFLGTLIAVYAMTLSPTFPERAWSGIIVLALIGLMNLLFNVLTLKRVYYFITINFAFIYFLTFTSEYLVTFKEIVDLRNTWIERVNIINNEKAKGNFDIVLPYYKPIMNSHNPNYMITDILNDPNVWPNKDIAEYYGLNSIIMSDN